MDMSLKGNGGTVERLDAISPALPTGPGAGRTAYSQRQPVSPSINKVADLKRAELQGENYTISDEQLVKAIERSIRALQGKATSLEFSFHEKTKTIAVKILDSDTGDVIKEIPPEKTLDFVAKLWEMAGLFIDEKG